MEGKKADKEKVDLTILPFRALTEVAWCFMYGERKYARHNYRNLESSRFIKAAMRHLTAYMDDPDSIDEEQNSSHLIPAIASLLAALDIELRGNNRHKYLFDKRVIQEVKEYDG